MKQLNIPFRRNDVFQGAVVKSNGPADRTIRTFVRNDTGLLIDMTARLSAMKPVLTEMQASLIKAIADAAIAGQRSCLQL